MNQIKQKLILFTNFILLSVVYFVGIGLTSVMAKIFRHNFITKQNKKQSSFVVFKKSTDLERMF